MVEAEPLVAEPAEEPVVGGYAPPPLADDDEVFAYVRDFLADQARQSRKPSSMAPGSCLYRGPDGVRCAIGALIADEHYDATFEGESCASEPVTDAIKATLGFLPHHKLLLELQAVHDLYQPTVWPHRFQEVWLRKRWGRPLSWELRLGTAMVGDACVDVTTSAPMASF